MIRPSTSPTGADLKRVRPFLRAIVRLDGSAEGRPEDAVGTAFLAAPGRLITNAHVVAELEDRTDPRHRGSWSARFGVEQSPRPGRVRVPIEGVIARDDQLDLAMLAVRRLFGEPLELALERAIPGAQVATISYPSYDARVPDWVAQLFGGRSAASMRRRAPSFGAPRTGGSFTTAPRSAETPARPYSTLQPQRSQVSTGAVSTTTRTTPLALRSCADSSLPTADVANCSWRIGSSCRLAASRVDATRAARLPTQPRGV